jgi:hypothetical protein
VDIGDSRLYERQERERREKERQQEAELQAGIDEAIRRSLDGVRVFVSCCSPRVLASLTLTNSALPASGKSTSADGGKDGSARDRREEGTQADDGGCPGGKTYACLCVPCV